MINQDRIFLKQPANDNSDKFFKKTLNSLTASTLHKRSCPQPGRYTVLDLLPTPQLKVSRRHRRRARAERIWRNGEESNEAISVQASPDACQNADVQIGCTSSGQNEMIIQESCKRSEIGRSCCEDSSDVGVTIGFLLTDILKL